MKGSLRKHFKKTIALVSTLAMMGSFTDLSGISDILSYHMTSASAEGDGDEENTEGTPNTTDESQKFSRINVQISNSYSNFPEIRGTVSIYVSDDDDSGYLLKDVPYTLKEKSMESVTLSTDLIAEGKYFVRVKAEGFATFTQRIAVDANTTYRVPVTLGFDEKRFNYRDIYDMDEDGNILTNADGSYVIKQSASDASPGVLRLGDVNKDGKIDTKDSDALLAAIESNLRGDTFDKEGFYDLNADGKVNYNDLITFGNTSINTKKFETIAAIENSISPEYLKTLVKEETIGNAEIKGSLADILNKSKTTETGENGEKAEEPAPLQLESKEEISEKNPVGVAMEMEEPQDLKEIAFQSNVDDGAIDVELADGTILKVPLTKDGETPKKVTVETPEENPEGNPEGEQSEAPEENPEEAPESERSEAPEETPEETPEGDQPDLEQLNYDSAMVYAFDDAGNRVYADNGMAAGEAESEVTATVDKDGNIKLDLGKQIAVKKITLTITKAKNTTLAEIGKVEFLNGMENRLDEPQIDFPTNVQVSQMNVRDLDAGINITWDRPLNSGTYEFEVSLSPSVDSEGNFTSRISRLDQEKTIIEGDNKATLQSQHGMFKLIQINRTYYVHVRTIDGEGYKSKWSDTAKITTVSKSTPDKPDYVNATGAFRSLKVSWGSDVTNSTTGYILYYRRMTDKLDDQNNPLDENGNVIPWEEKNVGFTTSYNLTGLEDQSNYQVYVRGYNSLGYSPSSVPAQARTESASGTLIRKYNAINCSDKGSLGSEHIVSVTRNGGEILGVGPTHNDYKTANSGKGSAWSVVDGDHSTYYKYNRWNDDWVTFEFDQEYELNSFAIVAPYAGPNFFQMSVQSFNEETGQWYNVCSGWASEGKTWDKNNNMYYIKTIPYTKTKKIRLSFANYAGECKEIAYSEIVFYHYESLMDDIMNLYADDLHTVLKEDVTQEKIDELRAKIELPDPRNGEYHPNKASLSNELNTAEKILNAEHITDPILVHNSLTTYDPVSSGTSRKYSGLNAWQPLGVSAGGNTEVTVYVGGTNNNNGHIMKSGESTELKLVATQYNSESSGLILKTVDLKIGANTITIPAGTIAGAEAGGALYIQNRSGDQSKVFYSVRVEGGSQIPVLDLYKVNDREERIKRAETYIEELETYVANMENEHNRVHKDSKHFDERNASLDYSFNKQTCIAGASDILYNQMMYSLPAPQILAGVGNGSVHDRAVTLVNSMDAMENMMTLFYQHKGMSNYAGAVENRIPNQHLNIRYQRMFQGASMYAAGNHIGIQWGDASAMVSSPGVTSDENGKYQSGYYFGWGIAHEIGHNINDQSYVVAEITNNYFSMLSQSQDKNAGSRLDYNAIYKKVTSGAKGQAAQGVQLGMYWQLHLAFDKSYNFKTFDSEQAILDNLFYARMDTYSRNPSKAPAPQGIALTLSGGDQNLMRLACAASGKNVLEFFERWGKTPDGETRRYASQFPLEKRAIMYANEDSRVYAMAGGNSSLVDENENSLKAIEKVDVSVGTGSKANKVQLSIKVADGVNKSEIIGYEIYRCTISNGDVKETPVAFSKTTEYTDTVTSFNNRTVSYKVVAVDQYLYRSEVCATEMVKIEHDGSLDKSTWTITTENSASHKLVADMIVEESTPDGLLPCENTVINPAVYAFDNDLSTAYEATVTGSPSIYINMNQPQVVCGVKVQFANEENSTKRFFMYVKDPTTGGWIYAGHDTLDANGVIYFRDTDSRLDRKYISTYETSEVRVQILDKNGKKVSISEIDVLGPTGDNVDFRRAGNTGDTAFGILAEDYKYGDKTTDYIPKDSVVFVGSYKGSPSYNAVILYDQNGDIVGGNGVDDYAESNQIILADVPDGALITDVSNGTFVYWVDPKHAANMKWPEKVRVELYRLNNAITMTGQRLVSDSLFEELPEKSQLKKITLGGDINYGDTETNEETTASEANTEDEIATPVNAEESAPAEIPAENSEESESETSEESKSETSEESGTEGSDTEETEDGDDTD
ncbi:MAG: M60 family metallopeptidase [Ruminococcus sp.]|nr:M60 family metallopeptidase [Ruminococcus sp.]